MKYSTKYTPVWNGLWCRKHREKLGAAWCLFGYLLSRVNKNGVVSICYRTISEDTGESIRTLGFWMASLRREGYVIVKKTSLMMIQINKFRSIKNVNSCGDIRQELAEPETEVLQDVADRSCKGLPNVLRDLAEPNSITGGKSIDKAVPLNSFKIKQRKNVRESKSPNDSLSGNPQKQLTRFDERDLQTAEFIYEKIRQLNPTHKRPKLDVWGNDIRLMVERDQRSHTEIERLFTWANNDPFWKSNILSPGKLRDKWDQLVIQQTAKRTVGGNKSQADHNSASNGRVVL